MKLANLIRILIAVLPCVIPAAVFAQDANYELTFEARWGSPAPVPATAHFTQLIGATHNAAGSLYTVGQQATVGVEDVAELGVIGNLTSEINAGIESGTVESLLFGVDTFIQPQEVDTFSFSASASHSRFTILSMIAPSSDWFVGVNDLDLLDANGNWRDRIVVDLISYDAGTEDGTGFSLSNPSTSPQGVITELDIAEPTGALFGVGSIARLTLTRTVPEPGNASILFAVGLLGLIRRRKHSMPIESFLSR